MASKKILVVGSFVQDLTWNTPRFPSPGQTVVGTFTTGPGGKGSNQAVAAVRAGGPTCFVGAVGDDPFGREVVNFYDQDKLEHHLAVKQGSPTGTAAILVNADGQNEIVVALGASAELQPDDIPDHLFDGVGSVVCQFECNLPATLYTLSEARRRGIRTILNPAPIRHDLSLEMLRDVDILIPNESEFCSLLEQLGEARIEESTLAKMDESALRALCRKTGVPDVILTLGKHGCFVDPADGPSTRIPILPDLQVVDTTGAGDAFIGGFAAGMLRYQGDLGKSSRFGTVVAGLSVTRPGTAPAMPHLEEIEPLI